MIGSDNGLSGIAGGQPAARAKRALRRNEADSSSARSRGGNRPHHQARAHGPCRAARRQAGGARGAYMNLGRPFRAPLTHHGTPVSLTQTLSCARLSGTSPAGGFPSGRAFPLERAQACRPCELYVATSSEASSRMHWDALSRR